MNRYFYPANRAHHALSMAIDFGMKFKNRSGFWTSEGLLGVTGAGGYRIEIAEESLHLLEGQPGNLYLIDGSQVTIVVDENLCLKWDERPDGEIIRRNAISFHYPEVKP